MTNIVDTVAISVPRDSIFDLETVVRAENGQTAHKPVWSFLLELSREIPDNTNNLDGHMAEYLAGRFLLGLDKCGDLYSMAVHYEMKTEILKKKELSLAMVVRAADAGIKTAREREMYAFSDEGYLAAADRHAAAKMFRLMVEEKREAFSKAHYLMRKILERSATTDNIRVVSSSDDSADRADAEWSLRSTWAK